MGGGGEQNKINKENKYEKNHSSICVQLISAFPPETSDKTERGQRCFKKKKEKNCRSVRPRVSVRMNLISLDESVHERDYWGENKDQISDFFFYAALILSRPHLGHTWTFLKHRLFFFVSFVSFVSC